MKTFLKPEMEIVEFAEQDLIVTSTCSGYCTTVCPSDCVSVCREKCYVVTPS